MRYGYFDNDRQEYVIANPATPGPWTNYLGSPEYGALISNNAGGYSFARSGADGRILRYLFNSFDQPGRYIYIRDNESKDYWSASWQPVGKNLNQYHSECRHGTSYTIMTADYSRIHSEVSYYVPLGKEYEVWLVKVRNCDDRTRKLTVTGYCEFTNNSSYEQDMVNLQYSLFITSTTFRKNRIRQAIHGNLEESGRAESAGNSMEERFFGLAGTEISSWCGDKSVFLGCYHSYANPEKIEAGDLGNIGNNSGNSCGALSSALELPAGEEKCFAFLVGMKKDPEASEIMEAYRQPKETCSQELSELVHFWHDRLSHFRIHTPCPEFDTMINTWNAYNCFMTFTWSRAASFIYCGLRNGYGYRDTVQDIQGVIHMMPYLAKDKITFMLSAQVDNGGGLPLVKFTHHAGYEDTPDDPSYVKETGHPAYRADDALWLFPTVWKYIAETGDRDYLEKEIPFANRDSGTVYEHLKRAIAFTENHLGPHGLPAGLYADWNDCLRLGKQGESSFVAFQFYLALDIMGRFANEMKDTQYEMELEKRKMEFRELARGLLWDGDRFIRGFREEGQAIGKAGDPEADIWLNPQSWSVISGIADNSQAEQALNTAADRLDSRYGLMLMDPPYRKNAFDGAIMAIYNRGTKENGGIFLQPQGWVILAEALMGHGGRAFRYYLESCPAAQNEEADIRILEPFCYGQFTEGIASPHFGRSHVHWLTGTASTVMVGCVEGILGMRPDLYGLWIKPSVPSEWKEFTIEKDFRGCHLHIVVKNPQGAEAGFRKMTVNGAEMTKPYIPETILKSQTEVVLWMS
ncbi:MAG: N,N'-diacetylchitobiose phosphorylase [Eubacterium sp.]|nr:N,N'-diacetylchitobiose phosphorylase [Eubacterium sp.]